jgi:hypothetical protein
MEDTTDSLNTEVTNGSEVGGSPKRPSGAPRGNTNGVRSGVYGLMTLRKSGKLDGRTAFGRQFSQREQEYICALGNDPTPMLERIVNDTTWTDFYLVLIDDYLSQLKRLTRKGRAHPLLDLRIRLAAHRRENIRMLGLKRVSKELSLQDILNEAETDENTAQARQDAPGATNDAGEGSE